jgi:hypothetical protein
MLNHAVRCKRRLAPDGGMWIAASLAPRNDEGGFFVSVFRLLSSAPHSR